MKCPNIIVVEDDDAIRDTIREVLELEGYTVQAFPNGKTALDALSHCEAPCLILLDLMMPVMNGWEFLEARKACGDTIVAIPVYIVSAVAERGELQGIGASGYIKKPIDIDLLLGVVTKYCGANQQQVA